MASWTTPVIHATSDILAVTDWNGLANDATFLYQTPYANYWNSVTTSLPNTTITQVTLGGTNAVGYGFTVSSNNVLVPLTGTYFVTGQVSTAGSSASGELTVFIGQNGTYVAEGQVPFGSIVPHATTSTVISCNANDQIALYAYQSTGSTQTTANDNNISFLSIFFIGSI